MKNFIVPIFIPNISCPTRCVFCDQGLITSERPRIPTPQEIRNVLTRAVNSKKYRRENENQVAFYGGSFTGLTEMRIKLLLAAVKDFLEKGLFKSIRVSTRPDLLDDEKLELMRSCGVKFVELGAQSMDDKVLRATNRGHRVIDTINGFWTLRDKGFLVGIQLMPGLPMETESSFRETIKKTVELKPDSVRLYPTVVIQGTELARMYRQGLFKPLDLDEAIERCAWAVNELERAGIPVIRIGLMTSSALMEKGLVVAGPWHPSLGQMVRSRIFLRRIAGSLSGSVTGKRVALTVHANDLSFLRGFRDQGTKYLEKILGAEIVSIATDNALSRGEIRIRTI